MTTPVIHEKTEPLRKLVRELDAVQMFAKPVYVRELVDRLLTEFADALHRLDRLEARVAELAGAANKRVDGLEQRIATLERFPELRG
jgi:hypothetical protein